MLDPKYKSKYTKGKIGIFAPHSKKTPKASAQILSEKALGVDWNRPEEGAAWERLQ